MAVNKKKISYDAMIKSKPLDNFFVEENDNINQ